MKILLLTFDATLSRSPHPFINFFFSSFVRVNKVVVHIHVITKPIQRSMSVVSSGKFSKMTLALGAWLSAGCYSIFASISPCVPPIPLQWAPIRLNFSNMVTFVGREQRKLIFIEEQRANDQNAFQFPLFPFCSY